MGWELADVNEVALRCGAYVLAMAAFGVWGSVVAAGGVAFWTSLGSRFR